MLRSICFKNFVRFEEYQLLDFSESGPFIFIGENCSGKSSVFEGIRRCLKLQYSSSISSVYDSNQPSYFICNFETGFTEDIENNIICGIVLLPPTSQKHKECDEDIEKPNSENEMSCGEKPDRKRKKRKKSSSVEETPIPKQKRQRKSSLKNEKGLSVERTSTNKKTSDRFCSGENVKQYNPVRQYNTTRYYKFAMKCAECDPVFINLVDKSEDGTNLIICKRYKISPTDNKQAHKQFKSTILEQKSESIGVDNYIQAIFKSIDEMQEDISEGLESILDPLTKDLIFTFPLRSVGPLQWSESKRIASEYRERNYTEAENRCEIIKYFLEDNGEKFDKEKEEEYFKQLTQIDDYHFTLENGKINLPKGKFALLKTPEGILEAKAFSIIISSKQYKTILLEEPDRGMHPQFVERMTQIINQENKSKRVLLITHQKGFITPRTVSDTFIFRCSGTSHRIISGKSILENDANMKKLRLLTSHHIPDIFFARKVLFYEGDSEELFLGELKSQILSGDCSVTSKLFEKDDAVLLNKQLKKCLIEYTFIKMNSKDNRKFYQSICERLKLDHLVLVDREAVAYMLADRKPRREKENERLKKRSREEWKNIRRDIKEEQIFFWLDGNIEDMVFAMCENNSRLERDLADQKVKRGRRKLFLHESVKCSHITESVRLLLDNCKPEHDLAAFIKRLME
ncbi:uncharacterized protein LOC132729031 [Ruditapes philippinarum]|uniref:uncharacterized protein LOC132729031 n=1 Tax=Ruditapes philippinarum TaxID=129788 RepID=UPI00295B233C|nr:uncharacterized protein LOC132729031 [Ruditapes philippinarum]